MRGVLLMPKKIVSHSYFRDEIDKWILKEANLRARYTKAIERGLGTAAARIAPKIQQAQSKQRQLMDEWRSFIAQQQQEETLCQVISITE